MSQPKKSEAPDAIFARMVQYGDKLFATLADLESLGGLKALSGTIRPASIERARAQLRGLRQAIDEQLAGLKPPKGPKPKPDPASPAAPPAGASGPDSRPIRKGRPDAGAAPPWPSPEKSAESRGAGVAR